jgi:hypothetical protein
MRWAPGIPQPQNGLLGAVPGGRAGHLRLRAAACLVAFGASGRRSQRMQVWRQALLWLPRIVVACALVGGDGDAPAQVQLLLYPRYHLDNESLLARYPLNEVRSGFRVEDCIIRLSV